MPAVLLAEVRSVATVLPEAAAPLGSPATSEAIVEQLCRAHGGIAAQGPGGGRLVFFEQAAGALACALALQSRLAEHNRATGEAGRVLMRIGIHAVVEAPAADAAGRITDQEHQVASRILQATPAGRIFLSRQAHCQCRDAALCAFIPMGMQYFRDLPDPIDVFEAWPIPRHY
jgi:class 3 adenylate cyclase